MTVASHHPSPEDFVGAPRFRLLRQLGEGGMGVVYEVFDTERCVRMALKTLHQVSARGLLLFKREFRSLCDLRHPNLVALGDLVDARGQWFFTMERVEGVDLISHLRTRDPLAATAVTSEADRLADTLPAGSVPTCFDEGRLRGSLRQLGAALAVLHRAGKLHRDLKPSNVLVTPEDRVVVLDFGLVSEQTGSWQGGEIVGTAAYMAPEQAMGKNIGPPADWYAFGTILYEALTGRLPFEGGTIVDMLLRKQREEPLSPMLYAPDAPTDLVALCRALLAADPAARPDEAAILATLGVSDDPTWVALAGFGAPETVFVGRGAELATLGAAFTRAREGHGATVVVEGESGVGKSALVDRFVRRLRAEVDDVVVLRSRCHEQETVPYRAVDGLMDDLSRVLRRVDRRRVARLAPKHVNALVSLFPCLDVVAGLHDGEGGTPALSEPGSQQTARLEAFQATAGLLRNVAARRPVVAIIDDIQWADLDSLALLEELLDPMSSPRWLLLVTERRVDPEPPCAVRRMLRGDVETIGLRGFDGEDARRLIRRLSDSLGTSVPEDVDGLLADTRGHPLFLTQLVTHVAQARPSARGALQLDDALWAEMNGLPRAALMLLATIAAGSSPIALGTLAAACDLAPDAFVAELGRLRAARLVRVHGSRRSDTAETYHDRVRETVLARLAEDTRRAIHHQLARALADAGAENDVLAIHWRAAGDDERALVHARLAGEALDGTGAFGRAAQMWRMVLALGDLTAVDRCATLLRLGDALGHAGRPRESAESYLEAAKLATTPDDARIELERRAAEQLLAGGYVTEGTALSEHVLAAVGLRLPRGPVMTLATLVWHGWRARSAPLEGAASLGPATPAATREAVRRIDARWSVGAGLSMVDSARGAALLSAGLRDALRHGDGLRRARALCAAALSESAFGDPAHARRMAMASQGAAEMDGSPRAGVYAALARVAVEFIADMELGKAMVACREADELLARGGRVSSWEASMVQQYGCWLLFWTGELGEYRKRREDALREARLGANQYLATAVRLFPLVYLIDDRADAGTADAEAAAEAWLPGHTEFTIVDFWLLEWATFAALYREDSDDAAFDALERRWQAVERLPLARARILRSRVLTQCKALALFRAVLALRRGARDEAERHARRAVARSGANERLGPSFEALGGGSLIHAAWLAIKGDRSQAGRLREVIAQTERRGGLTSAHAIRVFVGRVLGDDRLAAEGRAWLVRQGVRKPDAFAFAICGMLPPR